SLITVIRNDLVAGIAFAFYPVAAIACAIVLARNVTLRRDSGFIAEVVALLIAIAMTLVAVRAFPYTVWFGLPFIAAMIVGLFTRLKLTMLNGPALVIVPFIPLAIAWVSITAAETVDPTVKVSRLDPCYETENYAALAKLPAGLVVTDIDYGPFLLALTPHSV